MVLGEGFIVPFVNHGFLSPVQHPGIAATNLMFLNTRTLRNSDCRSLHTTSNAARVFDNTVCTYAEGVREGICIGDDGGPLVSGGVVVGAVSWEVSCARGVPDVHSRVSHHSAWLLSTTLAV